MPEEDFQAGKNWNQVLVDLRSRGSSHDVVRREYLEHLNRVTDRNVIAYYSGWLQKPQLHELGVNFHIHDGDKTGFMSAIHGLDTSKGLDLLLHTPGGDVAATESMVDYLRQKFGSNIRVIVPQLALSGGTMIAMCASEIVMAKHSSLGPIDPQLGPMPAHGILHEFKQAKEDIRSEPQLANLWAPIIGKYGPTLIRQAELAIAWAEDVVGKWLRTGMFADEHNPEDAVNRVLQLFGNPDHSKAHNRHITAAEAQDTGLKVTLLEDDGRQDLQDAVLALHHAFTLTFADSRAVKIVENHRGIAMVESGPTGYQAS